MYLSTYKKLVLHEHAKKKKGLYYLLAMGGNYLR